MYKLRSWFWSSVKENENNAQTIFRVLGNLFRLTLTGFIVLVGMILIWSFFEDKEYRDTKKEREFVKVLNINVDTEACTAEFPVRIAVGNASNKTVNSLTLDVVATRQGRSTNILDYSDRTLKWDLILPPKEGAGLCYKFPSVFSDEAKLDIIPANLEWSAQVLPYSVIFKQQ